MFPERVPKYKPPTDIPEWNFKQFYCHLPGAILAVYCIHFGLSLWGGAPLTTRIIAVPWSPALLAFRPCLTWHIIQRQQIPVQPDLVTCRLDTAALHPLINQVPFFQRHIFLDSVKGLSNSHTHSATISAQFRDLCASFKCFPLMSDNFWPRNNCLVLFYGISSIGGGLQASFEIYFLGFVLV